MIATLARDAALAAIGRLLDGGALAVYSDTGTLLAKGALSAVAFNAPTGGKMTSQPIGSSPVLATGKASRFAFLDRGGREIAAGSIGTTDDKTPADMIFPAVSWTLGEVADFDPYTLKLPA